MTPVHRQPFARHPDAPESRACLGAALLLLATHVVGNWNAAAKLDAQPLTAMQLQLRLDPNRATAAELDLLPRIGEKIAANIIAYRESTRDWPAFRCAEDLDRVPRIGPATVELLRPFLRFPDEPNETVATAP